MPTAAPVASMSPEAAFSAVSRPLPFDVLLRGVPETVPVNGSDPAAIRHIELNHAFRAARRIGLRRRRRLCRTSAQPVAELNPEALEVVRSAAAGQDQAVVVIQFLEIRVDLGNVHSLAPPSAHHTSAAIPYNTCVRAVRLERAVGRHAMTGFAMPSKDKLGGVIHTYQKFDPVEFPSPTAPPPDLVTPAFEHLLQLRQYAPTHRGGAGPRRPHRPQPDPWTWPEPRLPPGHAGGAQAQDPRNLRNRPGPSGGPPELPRPSRADEAAA